MVRFVSSLQAPAAVPSLRPLHAAIANRDNALAKIVAWGDSVSEGSMLTDWTKVWTYRLQEMLRGAFPTAGVRGGIGFLPPYFESTSLAAPATLDLTANTGGTSAAVKDVQTGLGARGYQLTYGAALVYSQEFTSFAVHYGKGAFGNTGFDVYVDGVLDPLITNINTNSATVAGGFIIQSSQYAPGKHIVKIQTRALNAFQLTVINGVEFFYGDESKGIRVYNAAKSGGAAKSGTSSSFGVENYKSLTTLQPDSVIVQLGTNDAIFYSSPTAYQTDLVTNFTNITTAMGSKPFTLMGMLVSQPNSAFVGGALWPEYVQAMVNALRQFSNSIFVHMADWLGPTVVGDPYGLWADGVHMSAKGHALCADRMLHALGLNGGGMSRLGGNRLHSVLDFGASGEDTTAAVTVLDPYIQSSSVISVSLAGGSPDHDPEDGVIEGITLGAGNIVPGVSYDIYGYAAEGTWGRYLVASTY